MNKKLIFFSHPLSHYNTYIEESCIETIIHMLLPIDDEESCIEIMNPNQDWLSKLYLKRKQSGDENAFEIFREIVRSCDIIVGTSYLDGKIGAGVAEECSEGIKNGKEVYLILFDKGIRMLIPFMSKDIYNVLSIEETRKRTEKDIL